MMKKIFQFGGSLILLFTLAVLANYYRYRFIPLVHVGEIDNVTFNGTEGYTDKLSYNLLDTIFISIKAQHNGKAYISKLDVKNCIIDSILINPTRQNLNDSLSEYGCNWKVTNFIVLDSKYTPGYYSIEYKSNSNVVYSNFIIENHSKSKIAILAPISTWVAYNDWGGKSLYWNYFEPKTVYNVSTKRPFTEPINKAESNIANFFIDNYNASLIPDFYLENEMELLNKYDIIVLSYHCEYFSSKMYDNLKLLIEKQEKSLISLGANQIYWKTKWNDNHTVMECRKDLTSFDDYGFDYGGMWRHHFNKSEHNLLGVRFTEVGMHSYAPYEIKSHEHWIFDGLDVKKESVFGINGINNLPISGAETDKFVSLKSNMTLLAKGLNCTNLNGKYNSIDDNCELNAGADFIIIENKNNCILSTGSIESGAGLGYDNTFTRMITNFVLKNTSANNAYK